MRSLQNAANTVHIHLVSPPKSSINIILIISCIPKQYENTCYVEYTNNKILTPNNTTASGDVICIKYFIAAEFYEVTNSEALYINKFL
jgi:hypothetical protein